MRQPVDLASHINKSVERGHPADFPVALQPVFVRQNGSHAEIPHQRAVVRTDTGQALAVVSDRYTLVRHERILELVNDAIRDIDVGPVPRGVFADRAGARMRALFKFPALARPVAKGDDICPCLKIENTYDGTSRIAVHIGAFRFVCTNLAVGGGGVFAGGFMAVHAGEIPMAEIATQLRTYLASFDRIVELYRQWSDQALSLDAADELLEPLPKRAGKTIRGNIEQGKLATVYAAYNAATWHATHQMRSARAAFRLLALINRGFTDRFPLSPN